MSQSKQYHSKYKGVLVSSFTLKKFQSAIQKKRDELVQELADELSYIGEECVKIAREVGNYARFVYTLDFLYALGLVEMSNGMIRRTAI